MCESGQGFADAYTIAHAIAQADNHAQAQRNTGRHAHQYA